MVNIENLTKTFLTKNLQKNTVLDNITLSFDKGVYGLLGPNGSGKTTLIRCITGMYGYKGDISVEGKNISASPAYIDRIGYLPQQFDMFRELTLFEMMSYFAAMKHIEKKDVKDCVEKALEVVNLSEKKDSKTSTLSGGMKRRAGIAQAILGAPPIIILDEPTTGLDVEERLRFKNIISNIKEDKIIILSTHIIEDVEALCDRIVIINNGKLLADTDRNSITKKAEGKVYEFNVSDVPQNSEIQKLYEINGEKKARVLSNGVLNGKTIQPTVEDGYLCYIKDI